MTDTNDGFTLDTPAQITGWVLLSRVSQMELHMKGVSTPGLVAWSKRNIPGFTGNTVKAAYLALLDYIDEIGVPHHSTREEMCNYQVLVAPVGNRVYIDRGVWATRNGIANDGNVYRALIAGRGVILRTWEEPRPGNPKIGKVFK